MTTLTAVTEMNERQLEIFSHCEKYFFEHENPQQVMKNAHFFKEGYDAFGLSEEQLKDLRNHILRQYAPTPDEISELGCHFFATGKYEFGSLAIMLLKKHRPRVTRVVYENVKLWLDQGVENWAHADLIATKITPVFLELGIASMDDFAGWMESESKWTRRVAAVTMLYMKDKVSPEQLLDYIKPLMTDENRVVQQGVGWLLRELWKLYSQEVEDFLIEHKETTPRLIMQYATEKIHKDKKKRFRRAGGGPSNKNDKPFKPKKKFNANHKPSNNQRPQRPQKPKPVNSEIDFLPEEDEWEPDYE